MLADSVVFKDNDRCNATVRCTTPGYLPGPSKDIFAFPRNASLAALGDLVFCANASIHYAYNPSEFCRSMQPTELQWANTTGVEILRTALSAKSRYDGKAHQDRWDGFLDLLIGIKRSEAREYARQYADRGWGPWVRVVALLEGY